MYAVIGKKRLRVYQSGDNFFIYKRVKEPVPKGEIIYAEVPKRHNKAREMIEQLEKELLGTKKNFEKERGAYEARYRQELEKARKVQPETAQLIDGLRATIDAQRENARQCDALRKNMERVQEELEDLRGQHAECGENLKNFTSRESQLRRAVEDEAKNTNTLVERHVERHNELSNQLETLTREMNKLRQQYADKEAELASRNEKFRQFVALNTANLGDKAAQLEAIQAENAAKIAELAKACDVRVARESEKCDQDLTQCRTDSRKLKNELDRLVKKSDKLAEEMAKHVSGKTEASDLLEQCKRVNSETITSLRAELQRIQSKHEKLLVELVEHKRHHEVDEEEINRLREDVSSLRKENVALKAGSDLEEKLRSMTMEHSENISKLKEKHLADIETLNKTSEQHYTELTRFREERPEIQEKIYAILEENQILIEKIADSERMKDSAYDEIIKIKADNASLFNKYKKLADELRQAIEGNEADVSELEQLMRDRKLLIEEIKTLRQRDIEKTQTSMKSLKDVKTHQEQVLETIFNIQGQRSEEQELMDKNRELQSELELLKEEALNRRRQAHEDIASKAESLQESMKDTAKIFENTERIKKLREDYGKAARENDNTIKTLKQKHQDAVEVADSLTARIAEMESQLHDSAKSKQNYFTATREAEVLLEKVKYLENFMEERNELFKENENRYTSLRQEVETLRAQLAAAAEEREQCEVFMQENVDLKRENKHLRQKFNEFIIKSHPEEYISPDELVYE
jgi:chromosome segregation ATPase